MCSHRRILKERLSFLIENMKISIQFAFLLVVVCFVSLGNALKCHSFLPGDADMTEVECKATDKFCSKVTLDGETSRVCASANNVEGCKGEGSTESCYCQGDLCNSAVSQSVSIVSFLTSMLLYTLLN